MLNEWVRRLGRGAVAVTALSLVAAGGCGKRSKDRGGPEGPMTQMQQEAYIKKAIRSSSEGVILLPSKRAEQVYELPRLNEIAQELRTPAAICFLEHAIDSMKAQPEDERGYSGVPEGQVKVRARISPGGKVLRTEVLESGFADDGVPNCVRAAIKTKRWPENQTGNNHWVDIVYWVSLGMQRNHHSPAFQQKLRHEEALAGVRAKNCLSGRVGAGEYVVEGLNLVNREGATMINRIETKLPDEVRTCVARAFRDLRLEREAEGFVRPVMPQTTFTVASDGQVSVRDEDWLRVLQLEERAKRAAKKAELAAGEDKPRPTTFIDELDAERPDPDPESADPEAEPAPDPESPAKDPGKGGIKLDLGARGR